MARFRDGSPERSAFRPAVRPQRGGAQRKLGDRLMGGVAKHSPGVSSIGPKPGPDDGMGTNRSVLRGPIEIAAPVPPGNRPGEQAGGLPTSQSPPGAAGGVGHATSDTSAPFRPRHLLSSISVWMQRCAGPPLPPPSWPAKANTSETQSPSPPWRGRWTSKRPAGLPPPDDRGVAVPSLHVPAPAFPAGWTAAGGAAAGSVARERGARPQGRSFTNRSPWCDAMTPGARQRGYLSVKCRGSSRSTGVHRPVPESLGWSEEARTWMPRPLSPLGRCFALFSSWCSAYPFLALTPTVPSPPMGRGNRP